MKADIKKQMREDFIPRIEILLEKEHKHLQHLQSFENTPVEWIKSSEDMILHYEQRIEEYKNFAQ